MLNLFVVVMRMAVDHVKQNLAVSEVEREDQEMRCQLGLAVD